MPSESDLKKFSLIQSFKGYRNKRDVCREEQGVAISGSQNIIMIDGEKIGVRPGFSYVGGRSTNRYGIEAGGSWKTSSGDQIMWRASNNTTNAVIEILIGASWEVLDQSLTNAKFRTVTYWDATNTQDLLLLVNGNSNIYSWSGGITTFASSTLNTITKQGTSTWAEERFLTGTKSIRVKDDSGTWREFQYTGGDTTTTLTGVTPDPTAFTITAGNSVTQKIETSANQPSANAKNDFIATYLNHLFVFSETERIVLMSKLNNFDDFSAPTSPRLPGEAATFTLDEEPKGAAIAPLGKSIYIFTRNYRYAFTFADSADLTKQTFNIDPTYAPLGGCTNSLAVSNIKNFITLITNEPTFDTLGNLQNMEGLQTSSLSDDIKNYFDVAEVDEASSSYYKNNSYVSIKSSSDYGSNNNILVRNLQNGYWETPWTLPSLNTFEHEGEIYANDPSTQNTYKLLDGYNDGQDGDTLGAPISAKWFSKHDNFGLPFNQKEFDIMWIDGYITPSTQLDIILTYDFGSYYQKFSLLGTNTDTGIVLVSTSGGLGYFSLGSRSLGGRGETLSSTGLRRFRGFITVPVRAFYELQTSIQSSGVNFRWEVLSFGFNLRMLISENNNLKIN